MNLKSGDSISIRLALFLCIFTILFRIGSLLIFSDSMRMKAQGKIEDAPLWLGALDSMSMILAIASVLLVIFSGIITKGWLNSPVLIRILLPVLGALAILLSSIFI